MARMIAVTDAKQRDAQVAMRWPRRASGPRWVAPDGSPVRLEKLIRTTIETDYRALSRAHPEPEALARALLGADPELPQAVVGRRLADASRVYVRRDGSLLELARVLQVVRGPDGAERSRQEFVDVEATVSEEAPALPWTGRLLPVAELVRKLAFTRAVQLCHVSGLTYEFLYEIAESLSQAQSMLVVGSGPKGQQPLIFTTNGAPYRGFLQGSVRSGTYRLVLHLSNLELKSVAEAPA
jgi:hypothetical protein